LRDAAVFRARDVERIEERGEAPTVLGHVDVVGARAEDAVPGGGEGPRQLERRLAAELDEHPLGALVLENVEHRFEIERLEVELARHVVVGAHGLRVAVDHDGFVAARAGPCTACTQQ